jgi:ribosomal protein L37E
MSRVSLNNVKPPPLHGRQLGKSYCKGVCDRYKSSKPNWGKDPYETHSYCRKCGGVWMKKEDTIKSRCPCCNWQVSNKSRKSKSIGSKKKVYYEA